MSGRPLVIFGATSQARLAAHFFATDSDRTPVAYTVDAEYLDGDTFEGLPLVAFEDVAERYPPAEYDFFVALGYSGMNRHREAKYHAAKALGYQLATYVSSHCTYLSQHPPGDNCLILEDNTVQPFVRIGNNVTIWSGNHLGHDVTIDDHVFITSQVVLAGFVTVQHHCFVGTNATVRDGVTMAPKTLIGAGAYIDTDTDEGAVYVPARTVQLAKKSHEVDL